MAERVATTLHWALAGLEPGSPVLPPPTRRPLDASLLRSTLGPLMLMTATPTISIAVWEAVVLHHGSILELARDAGVTGFFANAPRPTLQAAALLSAWTVFQLLLLLLLPGATFRGPVTPAGVQPAYRENGVAAWFVTHGLVLVGWKLGWYSPATLVDAWGSMLTTLTLFAFVWCALLYLKGRTLPSSPDTFYSGNLIFDFFQGIELHPRMFGVSLKQLINCRLSMMGWSVAVLTFALAQADQGHLRLSLAASAAVTVLYLFKFFWWETGYFGSLDIMHDRFGYYICWGVMAWVPAVYCLPGFWMLYHGPELSPIVALLFFGLGALAIRINYEADAQRQRVRATGGQTTVWGKPPVLIEAAYTTEDGQQRKNLLLASGWWGVARHFHYVPELALTLAWTIPAGFTSFLPWFYLVFLTILLVDRAGRDEKRCAAKYGADWNRYREAVPWRMVPGLW